MTSSILLMGFKSWKLKDAQTADIETFLKENLQARVVVVEADCLNHPQWPTWRTANPSVLLVVLVENLTAKPTEKSKSKSFDAKKPLSLKFLEILQMTNPLYFLDSENPLVEKSIVEAMNLADQKAQLESVALIAQEQQGKLQGLYKELEERVQKRQKFLIESRKKNHQASQRWASAQRASLAISEASSFLEMEQAVFAAFEKPLKLSRCKIALSQTDHEFKKVAARAGLQSLTIPLLLGTSNEKLGELILFREDAQPFPKQDIETLERIAEIVALGTQRLLRQQELSLVQEQWQATFSAIPDTLALISPQFKIVQSNAAFEKQKLNGSEYCYQALFDRKSPCENCSLGKAFSLEIDSDIFEVHSQAVQAENRKSLYFNRYKNVTLARKRKDEIQSSARQTEIGSISASLAHELNNPLGGILSFVQLLKAEVPKDLEFWQDLHEMEQAVRRCQEIIERLLTQSRSVTGLSP